MSIDNVFSNVKIHTEYGLRQLQMKGTYEFIYRPKSRKNLFD